MGRTKETRDESETQQNLMQATLDVIAEKGIEAATARKIADVAGVNQALVFYHFGSVDKLVIAAVEDMSNRRYEKYESELATCNTLEELATKFFAIFEEDRRECSFLVLSQFVSASKSNDDFAAAAEPIFTRWVDLTNVSLKRALGDSVSLQGFSVEDIGLALISALLGVQFMSAVPSYDEKITQLVEKAHDAKPLLALLPLLLGNLPKSP